MKRSLLTLLIFLIASISISQSGWFLQSSGISTSLRSIYFINENTGWAAGDSGKILHTTDGGITWILQNSNTLKAIDKILFSDLNNGIAVGNYFEYNPWCLNHSIRLATTNGGLQWNIQFMGYSNNINDFTQTISNKYFIAYEGSDCYGTIGSIVRTTNNGVNWDFLTPASSGYAYMTVNFINSDTGWAIGYRATDFGLRRFQLIKTTNAGINWEYIRRDSNTFNLDFFGNKMRFCNSNTGYMYNYYNHNLRKTTDGGFIWNQTDSILTYGKSDYYFINPDTVWCIGSGGSIIRSNNGGMNWVSQNSNTSNSLSSIYFVNDSIGYIAGSNGLILKTYTGGLTTVNKFSSSVQSSFYLNQNYPNPFNPVTKIKFDIPSNVKRQTSDVKLIVYNVLGEEAGTLVNEKLSAGSYEVEFNGNNFSGGIYFYKLETENFSETKRMILLK